MRARTTTTYDRSATTTIPILELWGNLVVPLQGEIRDSQMDELRDRLLARLRDRGARGLVIDASGVWLLDSHLCSMVGRIARAARLMGAETLLCGLGPDVVTTLLDMGIELEGIRTALGLEEALEQLGVHAESPDEEDDVWDELLDGRDDEDEGEGERDARDA
ncbi:STAS domain-containing protein [Sandaracinus amylolyticus]|uniref:RsbS, negative regulator of sigma-B n=1 Tax=Sandaracinus amylolyticus TaxID=927083 RepID=A0A0F6W5H6_9BACT|nr:STAS domain-containing protein [Sandaracinus amylolyticus]AKF07917.1 RsbS, negative regulator of sigma-B [Sandaracinus amylolyticus]